MSTAEQAPSEQAVRGPVSIGVTAEAAARFGQPAERSFRLDLCEEDFRHRQRIRRERSAEVVLVVHRKNRKFLLHTKTFYPRGVYRLPSGGVEAGEDLISAVCREALEETGLELSIDRFLGVLRYRFCWGGLESDFTSYVFLLSEIGGALGAQDCAERISDYRDVSLSELSDAADALEHMADPEWQAWGRFRALAHRFAVRQLS